MPPKMTTEADSNLIIAAYNNDIVLALESLIAGADAKVSGGRALYWASYAGNLEMVRLLIKHGCDIDGCSLQKACEDTQKYVYF